MLREIEEWTGHRQPPSPWSGPLALLGLVLVIVGAILLNGCATTITPAGAVRIEGNVKNLHYERHADGSVTLSGDFDHAAATKAAATEVNALTTAATAITLIP